MLRVSRLLLQPCQMSPSSKVKPQQNSCVSDPQLFRIVSSRACVAPLCPFAQCWTIPEGPGLAAGVLYGAEHTHPLCVSSTVWDDLYKKGPRANTQLSGKPQETGDADRFKEN